MRVTIVKDDNAVIVDGTRHTVDCGALPADFHVLQWAGDLGEIEYRMTRCVHCTARTKKGNETISDLSPYQTYVDAWRVADTAAKAEEAARAANVAGPEG